VADKFSKSGFKHSNGMLQINPVFILLCREAGNINQERMND
jgi:hypothetical protein